MKPIILLVLVFSLVSCGKLQEKFGRQQSGYSQLSFSVPQNALTTMSTLNRGVMIYIYNEPGAFATTVRLTDEVAASGKTISVPNGVYKVFALGWSGTTNEFEEPTGKLRCGFGNSGAPIYLSGQSATVEINMSDAGCDFGNSGGNILYPADAAGAAYSANTAPGRIKPSWLRICADSGSSGTLPGAISCVNPTVTYASTYIRVSLMGYVRMNGGLQLLPADAGITGPCGAYSGNISLGQIPVGNPSFPEIFYLRINIYDTSDTTCSNAPIKMLDFKDGLAGTANSEFPRILFGPSAGQAYYLINAGG